MGTNRYPSIAIGAAALAAALTTASEAVIRHVDGGADPGGDGQSWTTALRYLQDALQHPDLAPGDEIWVAEETYRPDQDAANPDGTGLDATFDLVTGVSVYGGFPAGGGDGTFEIRDPETFVTILSGRLGDPDPDPDPACGPDAGDCFIPNGTPGCDDEICCDLVCQTLPFCCVVEWDEECAAAAPDLCQGARHVVRAQLVDESAQLNGFTITGGIADVKGGGMIIEAASPLVVQCTFLNNRAHSGGGLYSKFGGPLFVNCRFAGNTAALNGGGVQIVATNPPTVFINCVFIGNVAQGGAGGGASIVGTGAAVFYNCTLSGNASQDPGGGLSSANVVNCIVWGNSPDQIAEAQGVSYSCVQGGHDGEGNIEADPVFFRNAEPGPDGLWGTSDDDYGNLRLSPGSPCLDAADNTAVPDGVTVDLDGGPRFADDPGSADTGSGECPIVDMGAYELPTTCPWDLNCDGDVRIEDFLIVLAQWGTDPGGPPDFDDDGDVGINDFLELIANWGPCL